MHLQSTRRLVSLALAFSVGMFAEAANPAPNKQCVEKDTALSCIRVTASTGAPDHCATSDEQGPMDRKEIRTKGSVHVSASQSGQTLRASGEPKVAASQNTQSLRHAGAKGADTLGNATSDEKYSAPINISARENGPCPAQPSK